MGHLELASIGAASHLDVIQDRLARELASVDREATLRLVPLGRVGFVRVEVKEERLGVPPALDRYLVPVAQAVADAIVSAFEPALLERTLERRYGRFEPAQREAILRSARRALESTGLGGPQEARRAALAGPLLEHLRERGEVVVEGLLAFRLRPYLHALEESVGRAVDDHLLEREYQEFIRLLRYFVAVQEPRTPLVHLVVEGAAFRLLDAEGRPLDAQGEDCSAQTLAGEISLEDGVLSALIAAAPRRIRVHGMAGPGGESLGSVRRVFGARLEACRGPACCLCGGRQGALDLPPARRYTRP